MKGGIALASQGTVIARVYTSDAYLPLQGAPVTFTQTSENGSAQLLAIRLTDSSGLTAPLLIDTPDVSESLTPGMPLRPYAVVDISVSYPDYSSFRAEGVQVFPGIVTIQGLPLNPVTAGERDSSVTVPGSSQNL